MGVESLKTTSQDGPGSTINLRGRLQGGGISVLRIRDRQIGERLAAGQKTRLPLFFKAVALAFDVDDGGVVQQAVEDGGGDDPVAEDFPPDSERLVGGDQDGALLIAARDELEEEVRRHPVDGQVANLVEDEQLRLNEELEPLLQTAFAQSPGQGGDEPRRGGEGGAVTQGTSLQPQSHRQVGLADTRRTQEQDIVAVGDEPAGGQLLDHLGVNRGLELEVEAVERFLEREASHGGLHGRVPFVLGGDLAAEEILQEVAVREVLLARLLQEGGQFLGEPGEAQALELVLDPPELGGEGTHAITSS